METMRADSLLAVTEHPVDRYERLCREVTMLQARAALELAGIDGARIHEEAGYLTATAFVRDRTRVSAAEAHRRVAEARALAEHAGVAEAYAAAAIDRPRVAMLLAAARVSAETFRRDESLLVDAVARLSMGDAFRAIEYWKQAADREAAERDADHLHRRRHLHISPTLGGMVRIDGELDREDGELVATALRSLAEPASLDPSDTRSPAQRRADALVDLCADHLAHGATPVSGGVRPHLSLVATPQTLNGEAPGLLGDDALITPEAARRIACDATMTRVVEREGSILDVGRATRTIPPAIRRALVARDGGCTHPGCGRPERWCDAHHIVHWSDGGPTSLGNLVLLCRRHHRMRHEGARAPARL